MSSGEGEEAEWASRSRVGFDGACWCAALRDVEAVREWIDAGRDDELGEGVALELDDGMLALRLPLGGLTGREFAFFFFLFPLVLS